MLSELFYAVRGADDATRRGYSGVCVVGRRNMAEPSDIDSSRSSGFYRDIVADLTLEDLGQRNVEERPLTVRDVMTQVIHQVPVAASAAEAARLMIDQHIHRLVVTQGQESVGIIIRRHLGVAAPCSSRSASNQSSTSWPGSQPRARYRS